MITLGITHVEPRRIVLPPDLVVAVLACAGCGQETAIWQSCVGCGRLFCPDCVIPADGAAVCSGCYQA